MDICQQSNNSYDHKLLLAKMKSTLCLIQYKSSNNLNKMLLRQYFLDNVRVIKLLRCLLMYFKQLKNTETSTNKTGTLI